MKKKHNLITDDAKSLAKAIKNHLKNAENYKDAQATRGVLHLRNLNLESDLMKRYHIDRVTVPLKKPKAIPVETLKKQIRKTAKLSNKKPQQILRQYRVQVAAAGLKNHSVYAWIESARKRESVKVKQPKQARPKSKKIDIPAHPKSKPIATGSGKEGEKKPLKENWLIEKWDEKLHPRAPEGTSRGGEWVKKGVHLPQLRAVAKVVGDDWNKKTAVKLALEYEQIKHRMEEISQELVGTDHEVAGDEDEEPGITYDSWDMLPDSVQEEVKEKWMSDTHGEFLDSEISSWYDNGEAIDQAAAQVAEESNSTTMDTWIDDALDEFLEDHRVPFDKATLYKAFTFKYESGNGGYKWEKHIEFEIDDDFLKNPKGLKYDAEKQAAFPGMDHAEPHEHLTTEMRDALEKHMTKAFIAQAEKIQHDMEPPDYLSDSVSEYQSEYWDQIDDDEKFEKAKNYDLVPEDEEGSGGSENVHLDKLPDHFDPLNENSDINYKRTQALAQAMSKKRAVELLQERCPHIKPETLPIAVNNVDGTLWKGWVASSTSVEGWMLQVACADELGARLHIHKNGSYTDDQIRKRAESEYRNIGGWEGVKALVRAKWETTQYLLEKADKNTLELYRGLKINIPEDAETETDAKTGAIKLTNVHIKRNGCASFTTASSVANGWADHGEGKVTMRAEVPRTAVISIPAYGKNIHSEKEVVVAGTGWKHWDVWKKHAPAFSIVKIGKDKYRV